MHSATPPGHLPEQKPTPGGTLVLPGVGGLLFTYYLGSEVEDYVRLRSFDIGSTGVLDDRDFT